MKMNDIHDLVITPGLVLLPINMDTPEARAMLMSIGMQESRFLYRKQIGGPAHGFYQFERNGGVAGVLRHKATRDTLLEILDRLKISNTTDEVYRAIVYNDALATVLARLLLWTIPGPLPSLNSEPEESWKYYISGWRPGKPHRDTWDGFRFYALNNINIGDRYTENTNIA